MQSTNTSSHLCLLSASSLFSTTSTKSWYWSSASAKIESLATEAADLQQTLKRVQGGDQDQGTLLWEKWTEWAFRKLHIFRFYDAKFLHLLISRKPLKLLTVIDAPCH